MRDDANCKAYLDKIEGAIQYAEENDVVNVFNWNETLNDRTVVAFGLGKFFHDTHNRLFNMCKIQYLCDNNSDYWGKTLFGKQCISVEELQKIDNVFVIAVVGNYEPIRMQMEAMEIESMPITEMHFSYYLKGKDTTWLKSNLSKMKNVLMRLGDETSKRIFTEVLCKKIGGATFSCDAYSELATSGEYFEQGIWALKDQECFLDVGAYQGDSIEDFIKNTKECFRKIYAFELSKENAIALSKNVCSYKAEISKKIEVVNVGAWDKESELLCGCYGDMTGYQVIEDDNFNSGARCRLVALDSVIQQGEKVTTIKMDIEGAEEKALDGAKRIIQECMPKLAICLYHRPDDFWRIPLKIIAICPAYELFIRHHCSVNYTDTILYAYVPE